MRNKRQPISWLLSFLMVMCVVAPTTVTYAEQDAYVESYDAAVAGVEFLGTSGIATVDFVVTQDWGTGFGYTMEIKNTSKEVISNWQLTFEYTGKITSVWNATMSQSGNTYTITNAGWNKDIMPGAVISLGGNGIQTGNISNIKINGIAIDGEIPPPQPEDVNPPIGLVATAKNTSEIDVAWQGVTGVSQYELEVDGQVIVVSDTKYQHTGLAADSSHSYRVRVLPVQADTTYLWSDVMTTKTQANPQPGGEDVKAPTGLGAKAATSDTINVSWDVVAGITSYELEVDGQVVLVTGTTYAHTGLKPESTHNYKVRVAPVVPSNNYLWSSSVSAKTPAVVVVPDKDAPKPATLASNQWGGDYDGDYDLTWNMYYGPNASKWELEEKFGRLGTFKVVDQGTLTPNSPLAQSGVIQMRGKQKPGTYIYRVKLINAAGESISNECVVTVGAPNDEKTLIVGVDDQGVMNQFTIDQNTYVYPLENVVAEAEAQFEVVTNNSSVVKVSLEDGNKLKVIGLDGGRASIKITEKKTGNVRYIGCRVKEANGALPGMPDYVAVGSVSEDIAGDLSFWKDFDGDLETNKRMDVRYIYINGGPLSNGWKDWTSVEGDRARQYIKESLKLGMIPFFVYYNIPDSAEDYAVDLQHIQSEAYMKAYFENLKYLLDICKQEAGDDLVGMVLEPDFLGYMMQQSGVQPHEIMAKTDAAYAAGVLDANDPKFENTVEGLVKAINYTINKHYPDAYYGWQFNIWSYAGNGDVPGQGLLHKTEYVGQEEGVAFIKEAARITAEYYKAAGVATYGADFISIDKYGLDGAYEAGAAQNPKDSKWLWNADIWNNYLEYASELGKVCDLPVVLWQIPVGRLNQSQQSNPYDGGLFPPLTNAVGNYEDSAPTFFFGDTFKPGSQNRLDYFGKNVWQDPSIKANGDTVTWGSHMQACKDKGIVAVLFGAGVGASTDSVGSPPADHYWWITKAQEYYKNPVSLK
ncbi:MAG: cellulose binding domain-containing protein [Cellulosilyticaceae bacterium]